MSEILESQMTVRLGAHLEEIRAGILAIEKEAEGLLGEILEQKI